MMTVSASLNTPISFFSPPKLMPVFPPTEASTMARSVVGTLTNLMPRLNVLAANPPRSVSMPPPRHTISEWRVAPPCCSCCHTWLRLCRSLWMSPAGMLMTTASLRQPKELIAGQQQRWVLASVSTNRRSGLQVLMASVSSCSSFCEKVIFCFIKCKDTNK